MRIKIIIGITLILFANTICWSITQKFKANNAAEQLKYAKKLQENFLSGGYTLNESKKS